VVNYIFTVNKINNIVLPKRWFVLFLTALQHYKAD